MLFTPQEIQAVLALLNRLPMTPAEMLFAKEFFGRLAAACTPPPEPKPEPKEPADEQAQALTDDLERTDEMAAMVDAETKQEEKAE